MDSSGLFIRQDHNEIYAQQGYLHIPSFLNETERYALLQLYNKKEKSFFNKGFHRTLDLLNEKKKNEIINSISKIVTPLSEKYLNAYKFLLTSFMTKDRGADVFDIHQNWTFVDESIYTSLVIWIPLQDVNEENGCMYFIPGSDKWNKGIRGNNISWQYENRKGELLAQMIPLPMKAGDSVIFDDATIHYTSSNKSKLPRISIAQVMIPATATPVFYNRNLKNNKIELYEISENFYPSFTNKYLKGDLSETKLISDDVK